MLYQVCIVTCIENEGPYLKEWIDYHLKIGVDYFYLFNHKSEDGTLHILEPYIHLGKVYVENISHQPFYLPDSSPETPPAAMLAAIDEAREKMKGKAKWLAPIDTDEFIHIKTKDSLPQFLEEYEKFGALAIRLLPFGDAGVKELKPGESLVEKLTKRASKKDDPGFIKTIARPEVIASFNDHLIQTKGGLGPVDTNKKLVEKVIHPQGPTDKIVIHHYWARTTQFAFSTRLARIRARYRVSEKLAKERVESYLKACNAIEDTSLAEKVSKLKTN